MAVSVRVTLKETSPDVGPLRLSSMGSNNIKKDPEALVLPNYLRASIGSCHDICKFGRKRDLAVEIRTSRPGMLPMSPNKCRETNKGNNLKEKNSLLYSPSRSPSNVRKPVSQIKEKEIQPGAKKLVANAKNPQKLKMKPKRGDPNVGQDYGINASKETQTLRGSKKSILVHKTGSLSHKSEVRKVLKKAPCSKNKDTKAGIDQPASVQDIPEKILFISELNSENQAVGFSPEENICDDSLQCQKQIDASLLQENEDEGNYIDKEIDSIQNSTDDSSSSPKESNDSQFHKWDNCTESSLSSSAAEGNRSSNTRTRDFYGKSDENEMENVVLEHHNVEQKSSTGSSFNDTAKYLAKVGKGKVKALVVAFESVISFQDLSLQKQSEPAELPKFPLCTE